MEYFKGKKKEERGKTHFGERIRVTKDQLTKIPKRVIGIDTYPTGLEEGAVPVTEQNAEGIFKEFIRENKELFGVEADDLKMISAKNVNNRWFVKYGQYYKGIPVYKATVGLDSSEKGKVSSYAANYHPDIDVQTEPKVSLEDAIGTSIETYSEEDRIDLERKEDLLIIYPEKSEENIIYHLAWKLLIVGDEQNPETEKYFIIDAIDGTILKSYTANFPGAQVSGSVQGEVYPENPTDSINNQPMRHEYVDIDHVGKVATNNAGFYGKSVPWYWSLLFFISKHANFQLDGPYAHVENHNGISYTETRECNTSSPCNLTWTDADRDHINLFYHMNLYHDWLKDELGYSWTNKWTGNSRFNARVNFTFNNAYAGNPMKFGTNNYARSSDVIYHECTHNILCYEYGDYIGWPDAYTEAYALDEGFADYFACAFTDDSSLGEGCFATPRNLQNTRQYPGKNSYISEGHTGGMLISGAAWDFRQRLIDSLAAPGARIADKFILDAHQILSTYPRDYYFSDPHESNFLAALYRAVDTDNNLLNGFPYFNDIQHAFHNHALLQAVLEDGDSYDFSTNTLGHYTGGDLYYYQGKFWANNLSQKGVVDLGSIGNGDLAAVNIPDTGYTRFGVNAVVGHTYMSIAQEGEIGSFIAFRVTDISGDKSTGTIRYFYRFNPAMFVANINSLEIHKLDCLWVSLMAAKNKLYCQNLQEAGALIRDAGYNGCYYCLNRYDADSHARQTVLDNLNEDLT